MKNYSLNVGESKNVKFNFVMQIFEKCNRDSGGGPVYFYG